MNWPRPTCLRLLLAAVLAISCLPPEAFAAGPFRRRRSPQTSTPPATTVAAQPMRLTYPKSAKIRTGRRLPRHEGRRSVSLAGRSRQRTNQGLGRGPEQGDLCLARPGSRSRTDSPAADAALELRALSACRSEKGGRYFYSRNDGLQNQSVVYVVDSLDGEPRLLLDPNTLSADGTVALTNWVVERRRQAVAYGLAAAGSDWQEWNVLDVDTGEIWPTSSSGSSSPASPGRTTAAAFTTAATTSRRRARTTPGRTTFKSSTTTGSASRRSKDTLVYERNDEKEWGFDGDVTDDGRYLIISVWRGTERKNQVFYQDLAAARRARRRADRRLRRRVSTSSATTGRSFWLSTDLDAPLRRVIAIDIAQARARQLARSDSRSRPTRWKASASSASTSSPSICTMPARPSASSTSTGKHVRDVTAARPRLGRRLRRPARRHRDVLLVHQLHRRRRSIYRYDMKTGESTLFRAAEGGVRPERLRDEAGLLHEQGRHAACRC